MEWEDEKHIKVCEGSKRRKWAHSLCPSCYVKKKINFSDNKIEIHKVKKVTDLEQIVAMLINSIKIKRQNETQETT